MSEPQPLCVGKHELFDSRDYRDHVAARALCLKCPVLSKCLTRLSEVKRDACIDGQPEGTWAGTLQGRRDNCSRGRVA